jgi:hypothetical protein
MQDYRQIVALVAGIVVMCAGCDGGGGGDGGSLDALPLIADFESGSDPTILGGAIGVWNTGASATASYVSGGAGGSKYAAQVTISGNTGGGSAGWTGAGLVLTLRGDGAALDVSGYSFIELDVRMTAGSQLSATTVKLEDQAGTDRPERSIGSIGTASWSHVKIPLADFATLRSGDPSWWSAANLSAVVRLSTVSVHDSNTANGDGTLQIDNVVLSH